MSILWAWERMLRDPQKNIAEAREHEQARKRTDETDDGEPPVEKTCKACGYEGLEQYCPTCLADTMIAKRRRR